MLKTQILFYISLVFLTISLIGLSLILFGAIIMSQYAEPVPVAINGLLIGLILLPIGVVFLVAFSTQAYKSKKDDEIKAQKDEGQPKRKGLNLFKKN